MQSKKNNGYFCEVRHRGDDADESPNECKRRRDKIPDFGASPLLQSYPILIGATCRNLNIYYIFLFPFGNVSSGTVHMLL